MYGKTKKTKTTKTPDELHSYLVSKRVDVSIKVRREVFFFNPEDITSTETAIGKLKEGYRQMQRREATSMGFNLQYGAVLERTLRQKNRKEYTIIYGMNG